MVRILHTADWQLGKPFANFPGDTGALLREARFEAVRTLARLAVEHRVDAILVAGDVFDDELVSRQTVVRALRATAEFPGPWVLLPGNHDACLADCVWTRIVRDGTPPHLRLAVEPTPIPMLDGRLVVLPAPLCARRTYDDLTGWMDGVEVKAGVVRVGLAHGSVEGRLPATAAASNPIAPDRASRAHLDYLALGDWHGSLEIAPRTWYAGTPEPDRFPQNDPGWALLIEIDAPGRPPRVSRLRTAAYDWRTAELDGSGVERGGAADALDHALGDLGRRDRVLLDLTLRGVVSLAVRAELMGALAALAAELRHLRVDERALLDEPDEHDLATLRREPVTSTAVERLKALALSPDDGQAAGARLALRYLFAEARELL